MLDRLPQRFASRREACEVLSCLLDSSDLEPRVRSRIGLLLCRLARRSDAAALVRLAGHAPTRMDAFGALIRLRPSLPAADGDALRAAVRASSYEQPKGLAALRAVGLLDDDGLVREAMALDPLGHAQLIRRLCKQDEAAAVHALALRLRDRWGAERSDESPDAVLAELAAAGVELGPVQVQGWRRAYDRSTREQRRWSLLGLVRGSRALVEHVRSDPALRAAALSAFALPLGDLIDLAGEDGLWSAVVRAVDEADRDVAAERSPHVRWLFRGLGRLLAAWPERGDRFLALVVAPGRTPRVARVLGEHLLRCAPSVALTGARRLLATEACPDLIDGVLDGLAWPPHRGSTDPLPEDARAFLLQLVDLPTPRWRAPALRLLVEAADPDGACLTRCDSLTEDADPEVRVLAQGRRALAGRDDALLALVRAVTPARDHLARLAVEQLGRVGGDGAWLMLCAALRAPESVPDCPCCGDPWVWATARALGRGGLPRLTGALLPRYWALEHEASTCAVRDAIVALLPEEPGSLSPCEAPAP